MRVLNAIIYHLRNYERNQLEKDNIYRTYANLEEGYILASVIREGINALFGKEYRIKKIIPLIKDVNLVKEIIERKKYYDNYKSELSLRCIFKIRNDYSFHLKESIYIDSINEGIAKNDLRVAVSLTNMNRDIIYQPPSDCILNDMHLFLQNNGEEDSIEYLYKTINMEANSIYELLNNVLNAVIGANSYITKEDHHFTDTL